MLCHLQSKQACFSLNSSISFQREPKKTAERKTKESTFPHEFSKSNFITWAKPYLNKFEKEEKLEEGCWRLLNTFKEVVGSLGWVILQYRRIIFFIYEFNRVWFYRKLKKYDFINQWNLALLTKDTCYILQSML